MLNLSESQGDFQAALKMEPNLFNIELRCGHVGPCWSLSLCNWQILLLPGSSQLIPTTTCKIAPFCKVWHWCFKIMSVLLEVTELVIQGLGAFTTCRISVLKALKLVSAETLQNFPFYLGSRFTTMQWASAWETHKNHNTDTLSPVKSGPPGGAQASVLEMILISSQLWKSSPQSSNSFARSIILA